jgi:predicted nucleotidyltransferase
MLPSEILRKKRDEIKEILKHYPMVENLRVFGSVARGEDTIKSDIDFIIDDLPGTTLFDLGGLQVDLQELLGIDVHLLTPDDIHPRFRENCIKEAQPI